MGSVLALAAAARLTGFLAVLFLVVFLGAAFFGAAFLVVLAAGFEAALVAFVAFLAFFGVAAFLVDFFFSSFGAAAFFLDVDLIKLSFPIELSPFKTAHGLLYSKGRLIKSPPIMD